MELTRRDFRVMIYYDFKKGLKPQECFELLVSTFGESACSRATVFNWFAEFKRGRETFEDEAKTGRPPTAVTQENVQAVEKNVRANRRITYAELERELGIGSAALQTIIHYHLALHKRCSRWVPHKLTDLQKDRRVDWCKFMIDKFDAGEKKNVYDILTGDETWLYNYDPETKRQSTVWCFEDEPTPTKCRRTRSTQKQMIASFFCKTGHIATIVLEDQRTVNSEWYVTVCAPRVLSAWCDKRPKSGTQHLLWHHDNAAPHTSARTLDYFSSKNVTILPHPPYSPDLAPCDFYLFPKIKEKLKGRRFENKEDALAAYNYEISEVSKEEWSSVFSKWFRRMEKCIRVHGDYFEKIDSCNKE
ncbi:histone-lysine N-methyltransferase SETMAR-like [Cydia pomonella]|uniref:histone-lysine N-methyltransferase SETMAR-like n=1 Tax=Cydia pomonella TaxID=82600 RepID=UPI002ADD9C80|nr:histone-lysine N-methyltransferase SETMAR-like [Cydia pomonella]XP_061713231.1 histone-lysine N-methyltransferase SETMAR-like [Cydia pomonella]XP_061716713.1 histone-lysine N-methyltransferase SETMAR-like [Cydia pomonella]